MANAAAVSLFIPGVPEQAITADVLGTDSEGRTTWRLAQGTPSGTLSPAGPAFTGECSRSMYQEAAYLLAPVLTPAVTATMVAGPKDVHFVEPDDLGLNVTINEDCGIDDDGKVAVCTVSASGASKVGTFTTSVVPFEVQVGATTVPAATTTSAGPDTTSTAAAASTTAAGNQTQPQNKDPGNGAEGSLRVGSMVAFLGAVGFVLASAF